MSGFTKEQLDTPICELEEGTSNTETLREFIRNSEKEFGMFPMDLEKIDEDELNQYIEFLDYLWEK